MLELLFLIIVFASIYLFYLGTGKNKLVLNFFSVWMILISMAANLDVFKDTSAFPPRIMLVLVSNIIYVVYFYRKLDVKLIESSYLIGIHVLRILVEIVLFLLFLKGMVPQIMTFEGLNYDILSGVSALGILLILRFSNGGLNQKLFRMWNYFGIIMLAIIVVIATLSAPTPFQQLAFMQPNIAILSFPYTLLPAIVVPIVLLSHLLLLKKG
ncbi:MAG: hypothetical protein K9H61_06275 [Bacteroidia bacterium]|nr:hypothetical protein [Bacteroidia bacterium]MCF8425278.1 hypothetical protein [Bacteroidia bacterium]MCF8446584.1 hypothetical protein [Bacteroidia bacterium]